AGRYRVERLLGRGGFAEVYLARHVEISSLKVAIKVLHPVHRERAVILRRFRREAGVLGLLRNRHTVRLIDFGSTEDETPYLVMEYVEGAPLDRVIRQQGPMRDSDVARVAIGTLKALAEAHDLGVVHRDLKPGNIFLVNEPGETHPVARVLDFGIAKVMGDPDTDVRSAAGSVLVAKTRTDAVFCTPMYAAP
ncbi:MAG: serine/threonine protein kinase, partial [Gemmatimonadetes bacterium]|nr:serine/threonine protein kinase [Gemmatimonadota bacterium]